VKTQGLPEIDIQEELDRVLHWIMLLLIQRSIGLCTYFPQSHDLD